MMEIGTIIKTKDEKLYIVKLVILSENKRYILLQELVSLDKRIRIEEFENCEVLWHPHNLALKFPVFSLINKEDISFLN